MHPKNYESQTPPQTTARVSKPIHPSTPPTPAARLAIQTTAAPIPPPLVSPPPSDAPSPTPPPAPNASPPPPPDLPITSSSPHPSSAALTAHNTAAPPAPSSRPVSS